MGARTRFAATKSGGPPRAGLLGRLGAMLAAFFLASVSMLAMAPKVVGAVTIPVSTTVDELNSDGDCSLREAIEAANTDTAVDACPPGSAGDTVTLPGGTYTLTIPGQHTGNATGDLNVLQETHLVGAGSASTIIDGGGIDRVLHFNWPAISSSISGVTITNGRIEDHGGGLFIGSDLMTINDSVITGNVASGMDHSIGCGCASSGGGVFVYSSSTPFNASTTFNNTTVSNNQSPSGGGIGIGAGSVTFNNGSLSENTSDGSGGGIFQDWRSGEPIIVTSSLVTGNVAHGGGGGLSCGNCQVTGSEVSNNTAFPVIQPWGPEFGNGGGVEGRVTVDSSYIHGNRAEFGVGGGLSCSECWISNSRITGNTAAESGGGAAGVVSIYVTDTTVSGNVAGNNGGGLAGKVTVERSSITGNNASGTSSSPFEPGPGWGGGLFAAGTITNSTISGNTALRGAGGVAGIQYIVDNNLPTEHYVPLRISNSTISFNAPDGVGNVHNGQLQLPSELSHTIVAQNATEDCFTEIPPFISGLPPTSLGDNLAGDGSCGLSGPGDLQNTDPLLGPLSGNGGPTETHALLAGSPAIDAGSAACPPPATDQRGIIRPQGGACDIGAFEASSIYQFSGFISPVDNLPFSNSMKAGRAVPVKFSLGGDQGLAIFAPGYPKSQQITCSASALVDGIEQTVTAGASGLSYDATTDQYSYVWKTEKAWAGTCRQLVLKFSDSITVRRANFEFR